LLSHPVLAAQAKKQQSQLASYDALGLAELIKRKQVSPIELVDDVIRRVERVNPITRTWTFSATSIPLTNKHPAPDGRVKCPVSFIQAISAASLTLRCLFPST